MTNKMERLQNVWHSYDDGREHRPSSAREAVEWGVEEGLLELPKIDPYDVLAGQMAQALCGEFDTDEKGRRYRVNHAVRVTKVGVQHTFWAVMGFAPHDHMEKAFTRRREHIVGECIQLKTYISAYNDMTQGKQKEIQLVLDFTEDVAEREEIERQRNDKAA